MSSFLKKLAAIACKVLLIFFVFASLVPANASDARERELDSLSGNYLAGMLAGKSRDTEAAAEYFALALKKDRTNLELIKRSFMLDLDRGNMPRAIRLGAEVVQYDKRHRIARLTLAIHNFKTGKQKRVREHLKLAGHTPFGKLTAELLSGWSWAASGNFERAIVTLRKLKGTEPFSFYQSFHSGLIADLLNKTALARKFFEQTYNKAGSSLRVVQAYGNFLERHGDTAKAIRIYEKFQNTTSGHPLISHALNQARNQRIPPRFISTSLAGVSEALFSLSSVLADQSGVDLALIYAQLSLYAHPDDAIVQTLLGDIYEETKQHQRAIDTYEKIALSSPLRLNANLRIAVNLDQIGKFEEAQKRLQADIAKDRSSHQPSLTLGNLLRGHEKFSEAAIHYSTAIDRLGKVKDRHWTVFYFRGICYERSGPWQKAEADFVQALKMRPEQPLVLNYLGYSWIEKGLYLRKALGMIERAVELQPNDGYIVDSLGWVHYKLKNFELAVRNLERAVELKPQDPVINDHLGDAYWRIGRKLEARFQWMHARDKKPEPEVLKIIENKLKNGMEPVSPGPATVKQTPEEDKTLRGSKGANARPD